MPIVSKAQRRWMHAADARGELPEGMVEHWEDATPKGKKLPERLHSKKKGKMSDGLKKVAVELYREALITANADMQTAVPGSELRSNASTGQAKGRATRTGVLNENKEFASKYRHDWKNSRQP